MVTVGSDQEKEITRIHCRHTVQGILLLFIKVNISSYRIKQCFEEKMVQLIDAIKQSSLWLWAEICW